MNKVQFLFNIQRSAFPIMLYLFFGPDDLARAEAVQALRAHIPADVQDFNVVSLDGRKLRVDALAAACEAMPFLHDRRLVIVEDALKNAKAGDAREALRAYLPNVPAATDLVFAEREDVDKRSAVYTFIKQHGALQDFQPKQGAELQRWLQGRAKHLDATLQPAAGTLLEEWIGSNSRALLNELHKLATYVGPGGTIGPEQVRLLVEDASESSVFAFVDALAARQLAPALALLRDLLDAGQAPQYLLFMVARQVRLLLQVKELAKERMRPEVMASALKQAPFVVRKANDQAARFDEPTMMRLHDRLVELDHWGKTGRIGPETALELLVAETCGTGRQTKVNHGGTETRRW
jgi:DNA polymerase-3 subunit delta